MRSREIPPLKPPDVDLDLHRFTTTNHHYETPINRKFSPRSIDIYFSLHFFFVLYCIFFFYLIHFFSSLHYTSGQHQHQPLYLNKRMILSTKRQTPAGSVEIKNSEFSFFFIIYISSSYN
jgi:hypothetical protein